MKRRTDRGLQPRELAGLAFSCLVFVLLFLAVRDEHRNTQVAFELASLAALWTLVVGLAANGLRRALLRGPLLPRDLLIGALLFAVALALRAVLATKGPGDLHINMASVFRSPPVDDRYGASAGALFSLLFQALPRQLSTLFGVNLIAGALIVPAGAILALFVGMTRRGAGFVALALLVEPILVRHAGEANRQPLFTLMCIFSLVGAARFLFTGSRRGAAGGLAAALIALELRPESTMLFVAAGALGLLGQSRDTDEPTPRTRRAAVTTVCVALAAIAFMTGAAPSAHSHDLGMVLQRLQTALSVAPLLTPWHHSAIVGILCITTVVASFTRTGRNERWLVVALVALLPVVLAGLVWLAPLPSDSGPARFLTNERYLSLPLLLVVLAAARGAEILLASVPAHRQRLARLLMVGLVVLSSVPGLIVATRSTTLDAELHFLRSAVVDLPDGAVVYFIPKHADLGFCDYDYDLPVLIPDSPPWKIWNGGAVPEGERAFFYLNSTCDNPNIEESARSLCKRGIERFGARPWKEAQLPNRPMGPDKYTGERVRVGFYEMKE